MGEETSDKHILVSDDQVVRNPASSNAAGQPQESAHGLSQSAAADLLQQYGYNELPEEKNNLLLKLLSYFWGPIPWMIEIAAILSIVVHHWADFSIILVLLVMNAGVGFWEEYQAGNAIAALRAKLALKARVKRDGVWRSVPAREQIGRAHV